MDRSIAATINSSEVTLHQHWLRSVVRSRVDQPDQVDDILGEIMSAACEQFQRSTGIENLGPWLYRVAIRKVLQLRRKEGRQRRFNQRIALNQNPGIDCTNIPIELILGEEKRSLVRSAMSRLSGRDAEILTLKYVHGWDYKTISNNLGIAKNKIAHRLRTARDNLKKQLVLLGIDSA